jgi:hypothetical protein
VRRGKAAPFLWVEGPPGELAPAGSNRSSHEFVATNFGRRPLALIEEVRFASDSSLEGTGFEPSVPRQEKWSMPSSSDQTRGGRTLTLGGGAESSLEGRDIELSVSPKDIRTPPYDLCTNRSDRRQISGEGPMVRIHFPPAVSPLRT